ncbi:MAG TPA: FAD-dependent oxidoreductase, partial [Rhodanobacter sp.]|nr:FAD-dependent oxidoreductase [Rhodanobacter sp.]
AQAFGGHGLAPTCAAGELVAAAIADGDPGWQAFSEFGLASAGKPFGFAAAQGSYWWQELRDALKTRLEA